MNKIKPKETHVIISFVIGVSILAIFIILGINNIIINPPQLANTLLTTAGIFVGFIISALGIYYSIPLRPEIKSALEQQGYYKQVSRNFIISTIMFAVVIVISIISICVYSENSLLFFQHILNSITISTFISAIILLVYVSINFFKIVSKNWIKKNNC